MATTTPQWLTLFSAMYVNLEAQSRADSAIARQRAQHTHTNDFFCSCYDQTDWDAVAEMTGHASGASAQWQWKAIKAVAELGSKVRESVKVPEKSGEEAEAQLKAEAEVQIKAMELVKEMEKKMVEKKADAEETAKITGLLEKHMKMEMEIGKNEAASVSTKSSGGKGCSEESVSGESDGWDVICGSSGSKTYAGVKSISEKSVGEESVGERSDSEKSNAQGIGGEKSVAEEECVEKGNGEKSVDQQGFVDQKGFEWVEQSVDELSDGERSLIEKLLRDQNDDTQWKPAEVVDKPASAAEWAAAKQKAKEEMAATGFARPLFFKDGSATFWM